MKKTHLLYFALLPVLAAAPSVCAEDGTTDSLHVLRPILHADQEDAEFCLDFDHMLNAAGGAAHIAAAIRLTAEGKTIPVNAKNISLSGDQFCLSPLEHRKDYRFSLGTFTDSKGVQLLHPYDLSFTMPARHPALAFVNRQGRDGLMLWRDDPVLHSVNNAKVTVELYRITDPQHMAEAWNQRLQTTLAPSESLYFARHNGELVWKGELTPPDGKDKNVESRIDFGGANTADFAPGLYLIAATDADAKPAKTDQHDEDSDKPDDLTPTAAAWLLRSGLALQALRDGANIIALVEDSKASAAAANLRVLAMDHTSQIVAEARSDANGKATLTPKPDKNGDVQSLIAIADVGDVAFIDLSRDLLPAPTLPPMTASLVVDQTLYAPFDTITATLATRDLHKRPLTLAGSSVQLVRPDHSTYDSHPVTPDTNGAAKISFPAPAANGIWHLVWKQADGATLADTTLRISSNPEAPELSVTADHMSVADDGAINLSIHSDSDRGDAGSSKIPVPYVMGHIELTWNKADHLGDTWKGYRFDDGNTVDATPKTVAFFLTDATGFAYVHVPVPPADKAPALRQAQLRIIGDPSLATLDPAPLVVTVKSPVDIVGIKPFAANGHFPENSVARFSVVALNNEGQTSAPDNLAYQFYEEGRSFAWYQSEGHWDYKPQQQKRRIGGGKVNFADNHTALIERPATSGVYQLDITNDDGVLLAQQDFSASWGFAEAKKPDSAVPLDLKASAPYAVGKEETVTFTLPQPAMVTASIADDHIRTLLHNFYPAGVQSITFTPGADWGERVAVEVQAHYAAGEATAAAGHIILSSIADTVSPHANVKPISETKSNVPMATDLALREVTYQTIAPHQSWTAGKQHVVNGNGAVFLAPQPFDGAPAIVPLVLNRNSFTTTQIARQLQIIRLWHDPILGAHLMGEAEQRALQGDLLARLLARQKTDGGFSNIPGGTDSAIESTAAAVEALNALTDVPVHPAVEQATAWLRHRLDNTWFGDEERAPRAAAYAALAMTGKLDLASLHYFSDTSADKNLPALTAAQIAYAFATVNDQPASNFWLDKAKAVSTKPGEAPVFTADTLPLLLANNFFAPQNAAASLEKASKIALQMPEDSRLADDVLLSLWRYEDRAGTWHIASGKDEKNLHGIFTETLTDKNVVTLRNPSSDRPIYVAEASFAKATAPRHAGQRLLYNLDGSEVTGGLKRGATYLVTLEGSWSEGQQAIVLHENPAPVLSPVGCAVEAPGADGFLGWLAYKPPTPVKACEHSLDGLDFLVARDDKNAGGWRVAYLAKVLSNDADAIRPLTARTILVPAPALPNPDDKDGRH